jgi:hypothetical protein
MRKALAAITLLEPEPVVRSARMMNNTLYAYDKSAPVGLTGERLDNLERFNESYRGHRDAYIEGCRAAVIGRETGFSRKAN